jgi:leucyl aminopeptidase
MKRFCRLAKVSITDSNKEVKNCIYFATEEEVKSCSNALTKHVKMSSPNIYEDLKSQNMSLIYPWAQNLFFTERMLLVNSSSDVIKLRGLASKAIKIFYPYKPESLSIYFSNSFPLHHRRVVLNSMILSNYKFRKEGTISIEEEENKSSFKYIENINIFKDRVISQNEDSIKLWVNLANSSLYTRMLANERPNIADCDYFEEVANRLVKGKSNTGIEIIKGDNLLKNNLNLIHAVGKSAETEPRLIVLTYKGAGKSNPITHAIVGKGLTFDTGGLNLKPTNYIEDMYLDKHGACNALSVFKNVVDMQLPINIVCAIGVAENSIDGKSYKPSDIITSHKGITVEIGNTDAEGRLVLCDVLSYIQSKYDPKNIIDLATLTGACMVALGHKTAGLFTNNYNDLGKEIVKASEEVHEPVWHLPITSEHRNDMKSKFAQLKNDGGRYGGASQGAAFLEYFIDKERNWVHLDIAGPSTCEEASDCVSEGASGFGTQLVLKYLYNSINGTDFKEEDLKMTKMEDEDYLGINQKKDIEFDIIKNEKIDKIDLVDQVNANKSEDVVIDDPHQSKAAETVIETPKESKNNENLDESSNKLN